MKGNEMSMKKDSQNPGADHRQAIMCASDYWFGVLVAGPFVLLGAGASVENENFVVYTLGALALSAGFFLAMSGLYSPITNGLMHMARIALVCFADYVFFQIPDTHTVWYYIIKSVLVVFACFALYTIPASYGRAKVVKLVVPDIRCPRCGESLPAKDIFCKKCGEQIAATDSAHSSDESTSE